MKMNYTEPSYLLGEGVGGKVKGALNLDMAEGGRTTGWRRSKRLLTNFSNPICVMRQASVTFATKIENEKKSKD
jgi:hypothetical protein